MLPPLLIEYRRPELAGEGNRTEGCPRLRLARAYPGGRIIGHQGHVTCP